MYHATLSLVDVIILYICYVVSPHRDTMLWLVAAAFDPYAYNDLFQAFSLYAKGRCITARKQQTHAAALLS